VEAVEAAALGRASQPTVATAATAS